MKKRGFRLFEAVGGIDEARLIEAERAVLTGIRFSKAFKIGILATAASFGVALTAFLMCRAKGGN